MTHDHRTLFSPQDPLSSQTDQIHSANHIIHHLNSPTLKIEDYSIPEKDSNNHWINEKPSNACAIDQLSGSPKRVGNHHYYRNRDNQSELLDPTPPLSPTENIDTGLISCPSSPLLVAMRDAVDSLNKYEDFKILEKIGAGFFAEVYKVRHIPTDQDMVLKINKKMTGMRKLKEVELLKKLQHPNILHYVGACVHEGQLHPLTEYMNGGALEQLIQNKTTELPWSLRLTLSLDIAKGMEYLHRNDMFHRDLNSKNVLLRKQGSNYTAVVADFGLAAKTPSLLKNMRRQQSIVGNPYWMAPEVLHGKPYNEKADVFSYGIILCEIISRLDADPDNLQRRKDYGMDEEYLCSLPEAKDCPREYMELAFQCCKIGPVERPTFSEAKGQLLAVIDKNQVDRGLETIEPQPRNRLSYHNSEGRPRSRSYSPNNEVDTLDSLITDLKLKKETSV